jgi:glycosyltransferase involved in cell wall biosynthesis
MTTQGHIQNEGRRMLMIAAAFPPTGGSGVQRSAKFAKYLPQFGWCPIVWTIDELEGMPRDNTLLQDLPSEVSIRSRPWSRPLYRVRRAIEHLSDSTGLMGPVGRAARWRIDARVAATENRMDPDHYIAWARASVNPLLRLIEKDRVNVIYSTFSPASNHWLGLELKRRTGLPWVADFRDLWTADYRYNETSSTRRTAHRLLEQEILETADAVIGVSQSQTHLLAELLGKQRRKFFTITNGFDPDDFHHRTTSVQCTENSRPFVLAHVGRFDHWRTPDEWFAGLAQFASRLGENRDRFELRIVGHAEASTRRRAEACGVACSFSGSVSHEDAIREMLGADGLLLNVPSGRNADSVIPAKMFEYLATQRPILVVGPHKGEAARKVDSCHAGLTAGFNAEAIAGALGDLFDAWRNGQPISGCSAEQLEPFSRVQQTQELAEVLNGLANEANDQTSVEDGVQASVSMVTG